MDIDKALVERMVELVNAVKYLGVCPGESIKDIGAEARAIAALLPDPDLLEAREWLIREQISDAFERIAIHVGECDSYVVIRAYLAGLRAERERARK